MNKRISKTVNYLLTDNREFTNITQVKLL